MLKRRSFATAFLELTGNTRQLFSNRFNDKRAALARQRGTRQLLVNIIRHSDRDCFTGHSVGPFFLGPGC